jgi:uncharacterized membrane protein YcjF (UPF0283 family)
MPEWFTIIAAIVALGGGMFGAVNGYRTMRKTSPVEEIRKEQHDAWKEHEAKWGKCVERLDKVEEIVKHVDNDRTRRRFDEIDEKLDNDNRRIKLVAETSNSHQRFLVLLLKAQQQTLVHLSEGNHSAGLKKVSDEIQEFLIHEAAKLSGFNNE